MKTKLWLGIPRLAGISVFIFLGVVASAQTWCWGEAASPSSTLDEGYCTATDPNGNIYITGYFTAPTAVFGTYTLTNTAGGGDNVYLVKYNPWGKVLWALTATKPDSNPVDGIGVTTDNLGNVFLTGGFVSSNIIFQNFILNNSGIGWNYFLVKFDSSGIAQWAATSVKTSNATTMGQSVATDKSGNVYVTGYFGSPQITFGNITLSDSGSTDVFIAKYDSQGNIKWAKSAGGTNTDMSYGVATDSSGNVYLIGTFASSSISFGNYTFTNLSSSGTNIFFIKYDSLGNVVWGKGLGGTNQDQGYAVATDKTGGIYITGGFWSPSISFGNFTLSHSTNDPDIFIAKYDSTGTALWVQSAGGTSYDDGFSITTDTSNNVYVSGGFSTTAKYSINFGSVILPFPMGGADAMFVMKFDSRGNPICGSTLPSGGDDQNSISVDKSGNAYTTGDYLGSFNVGQSLLPNASHENIFIAKFTCGSCSGESVNELNYLKNFSISPNPSSGIFTIDAPSLKGEKAVVEIYSMLGEKIYSSVPPPLSPSGGGQSANSAAGGGKYMIDISQQPAGIYFLQLKTIEGIVNKKIIISK